MLLYGVTRQQCVKNYSDSYIPTYILLKTANPAANIYLQVTHLSQGWINHGRLKINTMCVAFQLDLFTLLYRYITCCALVDNNVCRNVMTFRDKWHVDTQISMSTSYSIYANDMFNDNTCWHVMTFTDKRHVDTQITLLTRALITCLVENFCCFAFLSILHLVRNDVTFVITMIWKKNTSGLLQNCRISSALTMEML